ncbi:MAG: histidine kinase [Bacteroidetes bacterium]|nr:histidine kinase [Bacteroidota bacterium]
MMHSRQKHIILSLLACLLTHSTCLGQLFNDFNFRFNLYTTKDGLAHNMTKKCRSDSRGFLWIITENGLSRFDGYQFLNYQHNPNDTNSLPMNNLMDMALDEQDHIYLAYRYGLCKFDPVTGVFTVIRRDGKNIEAEKIEWDKKRKQLFILSRKNGLLKYDPGTYTVSTTALHTALPNIPLQLYIDKNDYLWAMIERNGYYRYNMLKDSIYYYDSYDWPTSIYQDTDGRYYLSTWGSGFQVFNGLADEHHKKIFQLKLSDLPGNSYISLAATEAPSLTGSDILWVSTAASGIGLFSKAQQKFIHHFTYEPQNRSGSPGLFNSNIYTAPDGMLWICSWNGLLKVARQEQFFQHAELPELHSGLYNCITGIMDDPYDSTVTWMAINGNGIARYNKKTGKIMARYFYDEKNVQTHYLERWPVYLYQDAHKVIWSCSYGGIIKINKGTVSFIEMKKNNEYAYSASNARDTKGHIWATGNFLFEFDPNTETYSDWEIPRSANNKSVYSRGVCPGDDGLIYVISNQGLYSIDAEKNRITGLDITAGLTDPTRWNDLHSVVYINKILYVGGTAGLLAYNTRTHKTTIIGSGLNLNIANNAFYQDGKQHLWIFCISGLYRFNTVTGEINQFTTADGIYSHASDPAYFFEYRGSTYLGYRMAYTRFNPQHIEKNNNSPLPYITAVHSTAGKPINPVGNMSLKLDHNHNDIYFDFTAIEYNFPDKVRFSYWLEGYDKNWSAFTADRKKNYTNLPPGKYTFRVKAINNNGKESTVIAAFPFSIAYAFWQTLWFKLLVASLALISLFLLYRLRINQITKRQEEKNRLQQIELEQYRQQLESEQITSFFSRSLVGKESLSSVLQDVAKNLIGKMGFEDCMIYLWNEDRTTLIQHAGHGVKGAIENTTDKEKYHMPAGKGIVGSAVQSKHPLLINDTSKDPRYISADGIIRYSELCVPVMLDDEVIGAINIEHSTRNYFNKHHIQTVSTIAALMANKIKAIESTDALHQKQLELAVTSRQLAEREIAMLRSQMNPHFIFNSLNSVQKFIWENKEEDAAEYLASFAKLMRSILENSRHEYISLEQEIDFLKLYVDLENRRSNNSFNYTIKTDETLNQEETLIPPMLLQPFIENAIWHGLNKKQSKGNLLVHFYKDQDQLVCVVSDDGVGRQQNETSNPEKKSLGISITQQRIERLMENTSRSASVTISDKVENGIPAGTEVTVILPIQTNTGHA